MSRSTHLHELLAVVADSTNAAQAISTETLVTFTKKPDHFKGQARAVTFFAEARAGENVQDSKELVTTVDAKLDHTFAVLGRNFDAILQVEEANQRASADLVVDGEVVATSVPATFLLGMEKRLKAVRDLILAAPTLDPSLRWSENPAAGEGVFVSDVQVTMRNEKVLQHKILVAATDKHPAQVEKWSEDVPVARIETTQFSGMLSPARKSAMVARCDKLIEAVKMARQRANTVEVRKDLRIAADMFDYITAD